MESVKLLAVEQVHAFLDLDAVTTCTVYNGEAPTEWLKERIAAIAELNPWLAGRLVKDKKTKEISLEFSTSNPQVDVVVRDDLDLAVVTPADPNKHNSHFLQYNVAKGYGCINKNEPIFRVVIATLNKSQFLLMVSMCHGVADGGTYYNVYNMLSDTATPRALIVARHYRGSSVVRSVFREEISFFGSMGFLMNAIGKVFFRKAMTYSLTVVKPEWIESEKEKFKQRKQAGGAEAANVAFISSNDILTCAVYKVQDADFGAMAVNFRNRVQGLTTDHCGNYEGILGFQKCDYEQPECIREMISKRDGAPDMIPVPADIGDSDEAIGQHTAVFNATMKGQYRRKHLDRPFSPTFWSKKRAVLAMVTNWASFYEQLSMRGCEHVSHFPVFPAYLPAVMPGAVIYKSNKDTLCLMCLEGHVSIIDALAAIGAVEGKSTA